MFKKPPYVIWCSHKSNAKLYWWNHMFLDKHLDAFSNWQINLFCATRFHIIFLNILCIIIMSPHCSTGYNNDACKQHVKIASTHFSFLFSNDLLKYGLLSRCNTSWKRSSCEPEHFCCLFGQSKISGMQLFELPADLLEHIASYSSHDSLFSMLLVNKSMHQMLSNCKNVFVERCLFFDPYIPVWSTNFFSQYFLRLQNDGLIQQFETYEMEKKMISGKVITMGASGTKIAILQIRGGKIIALVAHGATRASIACHYWHWICLVCNSGWLTHYAGRISHWTMYQFALLQYVDCYCSNKF